MDFASIAFIKSFSGMATSRMDVRDPKRGALRGKDRFISFWLVLGGT